MTTAGTKFVKGEAMAKLDAMGADEFCDRIISGESYVSIADELGISAGSIANWLALDSERAARVREANRQSARTSDERALAVLQDKNMPVDRAREIASHLRWRARVRDPNQFGDKVQLDANVSMNNLSEEELTARIAAISVKLNGSGRESDNSGGAVGSEPN